MGHIHLNLPCQCIFPHQDPGPRKGKASNQRWLNLSTTTWGEATPSTTETETGTSANRNGKQLSKSSREKATKRCPRWGDLTGLHTKPTAPFESLVHRKQVGRAVQGAGSQSSQLCMFLNGGSSSFLSECLPAQSHSALPELSAWGVIICCKR
jgi:hypothetical protein